MQNFYSDTKVVDATIEGTASQSQVRTSPHKSPNSKSDMYTGRDVARILKVDEKTIRKWRTETLFGCPILPEDLIDHNGVCYYFRDRIDQLATVFRKDWRTAWAKPNNKNDFADISSVQNIRTMSEGKKIKEQSTAQPYAIEMEKFVLSAMLLDDGKIIPIVSNILSSNDFYRPDHRLIFDAILKIHNNGKPVNLLVFMEHLRTTLDDKGKSLLDSIGVEYVLGITESAHTTAYAEHYSKKIKEKSTYRLIKDMLAVIDNDVTSQRPLEDVIKKIQTVADSFTFLLDEINGSGFSNFADDEQNFKRDIDLLKTFKNRKTGFSNIDLHQLKLLLRGNLPINLLRTAKIAFSFHMK